LETLNIISDSYKSNVQTGGPNKVVFNTLKGLKKIGQPYVLNKDIRQFKWNWIHDSVKGFIEVVLKQIPAVVGPNIEVLPRDLPILLPSLQNIIYLYPSDWPITLWKGLGFNKCELRSWAAGIDVEKFNVGTENRDATNVLIYFKKRIPELLTKTIEIVKRKGFNPIVIKYGSYSEDEYITALRVCSFGIWIGISESQGIGLQEALASNLPLIVVNVNSFWDEFPKPSYPFPRKLKYFKPTSAPYFNKECGVLIDTIEELDNAISCINSNLVCYNPSEYINQEVSLEKQANELLNLFNNIKYSPKLKIQETYTLQKENNYLDFSLSLRGRYLHSLYRIRKKLMNEFWKMEANSC